MEYLKQNNSYLNYELPTSALKVLPLDYLKKNKSYLNLEKHKAANDDFSVRIFKKEQELFKPPFECSRCKVNIEHI